MTAAPANKEGPGKRGSAAVGSWGSRIVWGSDGAGIVENTGWLVAERLMDLSLRFFVGAWLVRYLGPNDFGVYAYVISVVALFAVPSTLGLDSVVVRELSRSGRRSGFVLGTALALRVAAAVASITLLALVVWSIESDLRTRTAIVVLSLSLLFQSANIIDLWFQSQMSSRYVVWARGIVTLIFASTQMALILAGAPLLAFVGLLVLQSILTAAGLVYAYVRVANPSRWTARLDVARAILRESWPLLISGASIAIYMRIDQVMLGRMVGAEAVGIYGAAAKLAELWYFLPAALATSAYPKMVARRESDPCGSMAASMQALYDSVALVSYLIIIPVAVTSPWLIRLVFGEAFTGSTPILRIHIWALLFVAIGVVRSKWMVAEERTKPAMFTSVIGAIMNVGANALLIPRFEGIGAAWSTLASYAVAAYLTSALWAPLRPTFIQQTRSLLVPLRLNALRARIS